MLLSYLYHLKYNPFYLLQWIHLFLVLFPSSVSRLGAYISWRFISIISEYLL